MHKAVREFNLKIIFIWVPSPAGLPVTTKQTKVQKNPIREVNIPQGGIKRYIKNQLAYKWSVVALITN